MNLCRRLCNHITSLRLPTSFLPKLPPCVRRLQIMTPKIMNVTEKAANNKMVISFSVYFRGRAGNGRKKRNRGSKIKMGRLQHFQHLKTNNIPSGLKSKSTVKTPTIKTSILVKKRENVSCSVFAVPKGEGPEGSGLYIPNIMSSASCLSPSRKLLR